MRVLVTGASGLLGSNYCLRFNNEQEIIGTFYNQKIYLDSISLVHSDLKEIGNINKLIEEKKPDVVVNFAALANLEQCKNNPQQARMLNTDLPGWLGVECSKHSIKLLHVSTDAIFDGKKVGAYKETDSPNPQNIYAKTKLDGEFNVLQTNAESIVARVNFYGFSLLGKRSLAEKFLKSFLEKRFMDGFVDVLFSPLYVVDLVEILWKMVENSLIGLFHVGSANSLSKYQFGIEIGENLGSDLELIKPISVDDAKYLDVKRSRNLVLDSSKVSNTLQTKMPDYQESLKRFISDYHSGYQDQIMKLSRR